MLYNSKHKCRCGCRVDVMQKNFNGKFDGTCLNCGKFSWIYDHEAVILICDEKTEEFILTIRGNINEVV